MEFAKSMFKLFIIGIVSYFSIKGEIDNIPALVDMELKGILAYILITTLKISLKCALAMVVLVAADYAFQKWQFEKRIKMSKQEVKDELKTSEGDPLVKSRIKSIQMEMSRKRMMQDVPNADVVITNPTHFAVAIKYDSLSMGAPQLLAKGADEVARRIKAIAKEHGIPIVENKELARNLFSSVEIGSEIPVSLYEAVAEVLAYIYKLKNNHQRL
jgi:flagellar biosynthetic protein FlhB